MSRLEQVKSRLVELQCLAPLAKHTPKFLPNMPWGLARLLDERVACDPHGLALVSGAERISWRELDRRVNQWARFFQSRAIGQGDVVALLMENRPEFVLVFFALARLRAVTALINTNLTGSLLAHALLAGKPKAVLVGSELSVPLREVAPQLSGLSGKLWFQAERGSGETPAELERINEAVSRQSDARPVGLTTPNSSDVLCLISTSGTTGLPKLAIITNRRWLAGAYLFGIGMMQATARDIIYLALPLYHANGALITLGAALATGAGVALRRRFSASQFWSDVRNYDASIFVYVGELCRYLLQHEPTADERNHRLRLAVGNGLRTEVWQRFQSRFGVPLIREFYAATEGSAPIFNFAGRVGMLGQLHPGQVLVRLDPSSGQLVRDRHGLCIEAQPGEVGALLIHINPLYSFDGYLDAKASREKVVTDVFRRGDRYFHSGDLFQQHEAGWVSFADRLGDTYRWKGENVSTQEVAELLTRAEGVLEAAVYGVPVAGAEGKAGMAVLSVSEQFALDTFASYVVRALPGYQRPCFLRLLRGSGLRITATFKHQKSGYQAEGYDPQRVHDPLFCLQGERYVPLDSELFGQLSQGRLTLG